MSSTLRWEPADRAKKILPDSLKFALRKAYDDPVNVQMGSPSLEFLRGLSVAGVDGADDLIRAIKKHGDVLVREDFG